MRGVYKDPRLCVRRFQPVRSCPTLWEWANPDQTDADQEAQIIANALTEFMHDWANTKVNNARNEPAALVERVETGKRCPCRPSGEGVIVMVSLK